MSKNRNWRRRCAGLLWLSVWVVILYAVAAPWRELGGLVEERLRWLEWFVLVVGCGFGLSLGHLFRTLAREKGSITHLGLLRWMIYPLAAISAVSLVFLSLAGARGEVGVVLTAFLAYWGGFDLAYAAVPLLDGKPYSLTSPLPAEKNDGPVQDQDADWAPPWERF